LLEGAVIPKFRPVYVPTDEENVTVEPETAVIR
jgi:hypothetical protein